MRRFYPALADSKVQRIPTLFAPTVGYSKERMFPEGLIAAESVKIAHFWRFLVSNDHDFTVNHQ